MEKVSVLLIDDEEELVTTLVERMELRGIDAEAVTSGKAALQRLKERKFDVVVVDLKMPGLGGLEILEIIRRNYPETKVIMITGHGAATEEELSIPEGAFDVMMKPFRLEALINRIHEALDTTKGSRENG